jgi:hypothetical protein
MPIIRASFFYVDDRGAGWSESYHNTLTTLAGVLTQAKSLLPLRVALLGGSSALQFVRVSDDEQKRDSQIFRVPSNQQRSTTYKLNGSDPGNTSLPVRLDATDKVRRTVYMRGLPDVLVQDGGFWAPDGTWVGAWNLYLAELIGKGWAIKARTALVAPVNVTGALQTLPGGVVTVTTAAAHGLVQGDYATISGVQGAKIINGTFAVVGPTTGTTFPIQLNSIMPAYTGLGTVNKLAYSLKSIAGGSYPLTVSERKAGRPFSSPRGRRGKVKHR